MMSLLPLCILISLPLISAAADVGLSTITLKNPTYNQKDNQDYYYNGPYFLIPGTVNEVRQKLTQGFQNAGLGDFQWKDDSDVLSKMEHPWLEASFANHPELKKTIDQATTALVDNAQQAGAFSASEKAELLQAIPKQDKDYVARLELAKAPFFEQRISRWEFKRSVSARHSILHEDFGYVMDVSPMLARGPMVLVWYGGLETKTEKTFKMFSGLGGIGPIPDPHIQTTKTTTSAIDQALQHSLNNSLADMQVLPDAEAMSIMQPWFTQEKEAPQNAQPEVPEIAITGNPTTPAPVFDVPVSKIPEFSGNDPEQFKIYSQSFEDWQMLLLPDDQLIVSTFAKMQSFDFKENKIKLLHNFQGQSAITSLKLDDTGRLWGLDKVTSSANGEQPGVIYKLLSWTPDGKKSREIALPGVRQAFLENWLINPGENVALWSSNDSPVFNLSLKKGELMSKAGMVESREAAIRLVNSSKSRSLTSIKFNDNLVWRQDWGGYGLSAETGQVVQSVKTNVDGMFFGSLESRWGLAPSEGSAYQANPIFIINLDSGLPYLKFDKPVSHVARTAHGRLLALDTTVLEMKSGTIIAQLVPDTGYTVAASTFSWKGDKLWVYLKNNDGVEKVMIWDVPESLRDAALGKSYPDQANLDTSAGQWR
ncbi:hypothetical protein LVQ78_11945 [Buttiauxella sp. A2-C2_NF]|uniref:hypothetical protein n=1 Tax=Buttiauxella TaxID=82976 RepID=UPI00105BDD18|nr:MULTISPECIES: hypothetical protein [Buttiauxella]MCE0826745.1 hypothetical protein [Buttiauxella ferragutiae]TDN55050.1 hypothetical protein EC843_1011112 [Buttiauxella sp. JUb87]